MVLAAELNGGVKRSEDYEPTHHPSHSGLMCRPVRLEKRAEVDAIIVPTVRKAVVLSEAIRLSVKLGCRIVVLCSGWSIPGQVRLLAESEGADLVAVDLRQGISVWPTLETATIVRRKFGRNSDLSLKRNLGLALARMAGWRRLVFLDDDIVDVDPEDMRTAAALVDRRSIVAVENVGFPDNSVVCHAMRKLHRVVGFQQDSFVGGGAMVVAPANIDSFFPNIYNEDWLFMHGVLDRGAERPGQIVATGKAAQLKYDPFLRPERARLEEFGDTLGEGLFTLLDDEEPLSNAMTAEFWNAFLANRGGLLIRMLTGVGEVRMAPAELEKIVYSLKAALGVHKCITAPMCVDYMRAWRSDCDVWRDYAGDLKPEVGLRDALRYFRLKGEWTRAAKAADANGGCGP